MIATLFIYTGLGIFVIQGNISIFLKDPDLAHHLIRYAAGSKVSYAAVLKSNAGIGNYKIKLIKADSLGNYSWDYILNFPFTTSGYSIDNTSDNGYIIAGLANRADSDILVIRLTPEVSFLNEDELRVVQKNVKEVFGIVIGFDNLEIGTKPLRILPKEKIVGSKRSRETEKQWIDKSPMISSQGDGIKAYLKLLLKK